MTVAVTQPGRLFWLDRCTCIFSIACVAFGLIVATPGRVDAGLTDGFLGTELDPANFAVQNYSIPFVSGGIVGGLNAPGSGTTSIEPTVAESVLTLSGNGPSNFSTSFDNGIAVVGNDTASLPGLDSDPLLLTARGVTADTLGPIITAPQWEVGIGIYSDTNNFVTLSIANFVGTSDTQTNLRYTVVSNGTLAEQSTSSEHILASFGTDSLTAQDLQIEISDTGAVRFVASNAALGTYFDFTSPTPIIPGFFGTTRPILFATSQRPETGVTGTFGSITFPEDVFVLDVIPEPATGSLVMIAAAAALMTRKSR